MEKDIKDSKGITHRITDLTVKVPKEHKDNLDQRWRFENWHWNYFLKRWLPKKSCKLCGISTSFTTYNCRVCSFKRYETTANYGCMAWVKLLVPKYSIYEESPKKFKAMINKLRRKAKENIIFY